MPKLRPLHWEEETEDGVGVGYYWTSTPFGEFRVCPRLAEDAKSVGWQAYFEGIRLFSDDLSGRMYPSVDTAKSGVEAWYRREIKQLLDQILEPEEESTDE